jgi:cytochrome c-type biogenesis protein CcmE
MKISHIIALVVVAIAIGVVVSTAGDASTYVTFNEAKALVAEGDNGDVHVVGELVKDRAGNIEMLYQPEIDPNRFEFNLVDTNRTEMRVVYGNPKPTDFERSEKIVIIGNVQGDVFRAKKILMKCPSKYTEKEVK